MPVPSNTSVSSVPHEAEIPLRALNASKIVPPASGIDLSLVSTCNTVIGLTAEEPVGRLIRSHFRQLPNSISWLIRFDGGDCFANQRSSVKMLSAFSNGAPRCGVKFLLCGAQSLPSLMRI